MSTFNENEHPRDKSGQWVNKHKSVKPSIALETWFNPQSGTFPEAYQNLTWDEIPPIIGTQLKGSDGRSYEVSDYVPAFPDEIQPIITCKGTGEEVDTDTSMSFTVEQLPTGKLSHAYMSIRENRAKKDHASRDFREEQTRLGVIDCKYPYAEDVWDETVDAREAEVRVVDKNGTMYSTDGHMPDKYNKLVHKYRMRNYWALKEDIAADNFAYLVRQLD